MVSKTSLEHSLDSSKQQQITAETSHGLFLDQWFQLNHLLASVYNDLKQCITASQQVCVLSFLNHANIVLLITTEKNNRLFWNMWYWF